MKKTWELSAAQELCVRFSQNPLPQDHQKSSMSGERSRGEMKSWLHRLGKGSILTAEWAHYRCNYPENAESIRSGCGRTGPFRKKNPDFLALLHFSAKVEVDA